MMARRHVMGLLAVGMALLLGACGVDSTPTYRYRLTVEVDTPEGLRSGSSVIEVETSRGRSAANPAGTVVINKLRGQAAIVDLGARGMMFALLRSEHNVDWAKNIMFLMAPPGVDADGDRFLGTYKNMLAMDEEITLPRTLDQVNSALAGMSGLPMLVTFGDITDPTSVALVDPDDFSATFGENVTLRRITVQMTDDPVTDGILDVLPWWGKLREMNLKIEDFPSGIPLGDFSGMFKKD
jgi:hypothetical protein